MKKKLIRGLAIWQSAMIVVSPLLLCLLVFKWWGLLAVWAIFIFPFKLKVYEGIQDWKGENSEHWLSKLDKSNKED